jgi:hypothetical protein
MGWRDDINYVDSSRIMYKKRYEFVLQMYNAILRIRFFVARKTSSICADHGLFKK